MENKITNIIKKENFDQICRCCLCVTTENNIYEDKNLPTILEEISLIQISPDDDLPKTLCENCINQVTQFYIFKTKALESETKLRQILSDTVEIKIEFEESPFTISTKNETNNSDSNSDSNNVFFEVTSDSEVETFSHQHDIPNEVKMIFTNAETDENNCKKGDNVEKLDNLQQTTTKKDVKKSQTKKVNPKPINCICGLTFTDRAEYYDHREDPQHPKSRTVTCDICNTVWRNNFRLKEHMKSHTKEKPFECEFCGARFSYKGHYVTHLRIHTGEKSHVCETCGKGFTQSGNLQLHKLRHTGEKPFVCEICGTAFLQKVSLQGHMRCHTGEKPFICQYCGRRFRVKKGLNNHLGNRKDGNCPVQHKKAPPRTYECTKCSKFFTTSGHLRSHNLSVHTDVRNHMCDFCGKKFKVRSKLNIHRRTHTGEKPYVCGVCSKGFIASDILKKHEKIHEKNK